MVVGLIVLLSASVGTWIWQSGKKPPVQIPLSLRQKISFQPHLPQVLPGNYQVDPQSFIVDQGALVYQIRDATGEVITFAEQSKPKAVDFFTTFYESQLKNPKILNRTPYSSTTGQAHDGKSTVLSIVTDKTWLLITVPFPIDQGSLTNMARNIHPAL